MERHFFTTEYVCLNKCQYCFEAFNEYKFPAISYDRVEKLDNSIIYPACNTELFLNEQLIDFFKEYIDKGSFFNVFSFSTKNNINENDLLLIKEINDNLKEKKIGEIKISISITNKYKIDELEEGTATYIERLSLAENLLRKNIKTSVIIKPILPFIQIDEYKEIVDDYTNLGVSHFVVGDLYIGEKTSFYKNYIVNKYEVTPKVISWIESFPTWKKITNDMRPKISNYILGKKAYVYDSDLELMENLF